MSWLPDCKAQKLGEKSPSTAKNFRFFHELWKPHSARILQGCLKIHGSSPDFSGRTLSLCEFQMFSDVSVFLMKWNFRAHWDGSKTWYYVCGAYTSTYIICQLFWSEKPFLDELTHCHTGHLHSFRTPPGVVPKKLCHWQQRLRWLSQARQHWFKKCDRPVKEDKQGVAPWWQNGEIIENQHSSTNRNLNHWIIATNSACNNHRANNVYKIRNPEEHHVLAALALCRWSFLKFPLKADDIEQTMVSKWEFQHFGILFQE